MEMSACSNITMPCKDGCMRPGYAYVPAQKVNSFYDYESAFLCGTIFPDLVLPKGKYGPNENFN